MQLEGILEQCRRLVEDVSFRSVAEWKKAHPGSKVIGCFPVYVPTELIAAAGMLPVAIFGAGGKIEIDHADSRIQSFICSIARSTLELGLAGYLKDFDGLIFPSICDVARNLSGIAQRNFPGLWVEYLHLPQNVNSPAAVSYYRGELERVRAKLERMSGKAIPSHSLRAAIHEFNENRSLMRRLYAMRAAAPGKLKSSELYLLVRAGALLPKSEHNALLKLVLPLIEGRQEKLRDNIRVIVEGAFCEQPPLEMLEVLEEAGCYMVDDDFLRGLRFFAGDISEEGDPLDALARGYLEQSVVSSVMHPGSRDRGQALVERVRRLKADGVVFASPKFCEPALYDYVLMKGALEREQIPYLQFEYEEKTSAFENIRSQMETFVESILFFSAT